MSAEVEKVLASVALAHRFRYQDIGPIHYICWCNQPRSSFCTRESWAAHVAAEQAAALRALPTGDEDEACVCDSKVALTSVLATVERAVRKGYDLDPHDLLDQITPPAQTPNGDPR